MKIGEGLYRDGMRKGEIVYISAEASPDSQNPQFLTIGKASQFLVVIKGASVPESDRSTGIWEMGDEWEKRRVIVSNFVQQDNSHAKLTVKLA